MLDQTIFDFPFKLEKHVNNLLKETSDIKLALDIYHKAYIYNIYLCYTNNFYWRAFGCFVRN